MLSMEAVCPSEMLVLIYHFTRWHNTEDLITNFILQYRSILVEGKDLTKVFVILLSVLGQMTEQSLK
jgi:hypothetical protein